MFRLFVLLSIILSAFNQNINKYFYEHKYIDSIITLMMHVDILIMFFLFLTHLYGRVRNKNNMLIDIKSVFCLKTALLLCIPIGSTYFKNFLLMFVSPVAMSTNSLIIPFIIALLSVFVLKEKFHKIDLLLLIIALFGFILATNLKINLESIKITSLMLLYCIIFSSGAIILRKFAKTGNNLTAYSTTSIYYGIISLFVLFFSRKIDFYLFFSLPCLSGFLFMTLQHYFSVQSHRESKSIIEIEIINYSRIIITALISYFIIGYDYSLKTLLGFFIITFAVIVNCIYKKYLFKCKNLENVNPVK